MISRQTIVRIMSMPNIEGNFFSSKLATGTTIADLKKIKKSTHVTEFIDVNERSEREEKGWTIEERKGWKKKLVAKREKPHNDYFEDSVWCLFADMGFLYLNADRRLKIPYGRDMENSSTRKQIDVFAADSESVFLVECKSAAEENKRGNFKTDIEAIIGYRGQMIENIKSEFPMFADHNFKLIFATSNYVVGQNDVERMQKHGIYHFTADALKYYRELVNHIGIAARYQFLANVFKGKSVKMDTSVPAIRGTMGGKTYYAFAIEPSKLLRISRVLHKSIKPDVEDRTYQRIIKKGRLSEIRQFINEGGYFPNTLLINISSNTELKFEPVGKNAQKMNSPTRLGILKLPSEYGCAYIIDGQHRLYGYIGTKYAETNTIPVILFEGLDGTEQVKLFMEINEKQKSVPKNLQHVLNADLLWDDKDANKRVKALKLHIAQQLGDKTYSPLYNRVNQCEESTSDGKYITIDTILGALDSSCFFNKYKKNKPSEYGYMDKGDNKDTLSLVLPFLMAGLTYMYEKCPRQWVMEEDGFFASNRGVGAFLRIMSDVARTLKSRGFELLNCKVDDYTEEVYKYLHPLAVYFVNMTPDEREKLETRYGSKYGQGGPVKYWRSLQRVIKNERADFVAMGLEEFEASKMLKYNDETARMLSEVLDRMRKVCSKVLISNCGVGDAWVMKFGMPLNIYNSCQNKSTKYKAETGQEKGLEEFLSYEDIKSIASYKDNWGKYYQSIFTLLEPQYAKGTKTQKLAWLDRLNDIEKQIAKKISVSQEDYEFVVRLRNNWLPTL